VRNSAAANRYARALFSLAQEEGAVESIRSDLSGMAELFESNSDLKARLFQPLHPADERRKVLVAICERAGTNATVKKFFSYLIDQRRLVLFDSIREEFDRLADEAAGRLRAEVVSANPLRDEQRARLVEVLSHRTGKAIELSVRVDASLIGGVIASIGGLVFDGSIRTQLSQLHSTLTQGQGHQGEH
jgi:F-type H+-transporting ATPase subunit delta